jgi:hypothetical protein
MNLVYLVKTNQKILKRNKHEVLRVLTIPKFNIYIMSTVIVGSINVAKLPKEKFVKGKDGAVYYNFTISVNDETRYGNNVAFMDSQTKEEREAKVAKTYLGNGKVVWTDGSVVLAEREDQAQEPELAADDSDLPF